MIPNSRTHFDHLEFTLKVYFFQQWDNCHHDNVGDEVANFENLPAKVEYPQLQQLAQDREAVIQFIHEQAQPENQSGDVHAVGGKDFLSNEHLWCWDMGPIGETHGG
jgi:hypothetical protein